MKAKLIKWLGGFTKAERDKAASAQYNIGLNVGRDSVKMNIRAIIADKHPDDWREEVYKYVTED